jgi:hypothetical protein
MRVPVTRLRKNSTSVSAAAGLIFAFLTSAFPWVAGAQKTDEVPRVENKSGDEFLVLPPKLTESLRKGLPGFRVPEAKDRTGNWNQDTDAGNLPYAVWGDFKGDGRTDVALILLGNKEWKLAIFHQTDSGFTLGYSQGSTTESPDAQVPSAQILTLKLVSKGKPYKYAIISKSGRQEKRYNFDHDAIEFSGVETFLSVLHWKNGSYQTLSFGD